MIKKHRHELAALTLGIHISLPKIKEQRLFVARRKKLFLQKKAVKPSKVLTSHMEGLETNPANTPANDGNSNILNKNEKTNSISKK